ncbi:MAG: site-specific integrase [Candidatus Brocadiales bacterium]|nr:site-specific integrase [Candidatus Brocadiales bacterium]MBL7110148.1 site-specific integrase [Candidatus Neomarinimicrobiota bacterium]
MASLRKARGLYYVRLYYSKDGKNKEKVFPLNTPYRREAESRLLEVNQYQDLAIDGSFTPSWKSENGIPCEDGYRISDAKEDFLKSRKSDRLRDTTLQLYGRGFNRLIRAISDKPVKDLTIDDIDQFKAFYMDSLRPDTINIDLRMFKTMLNWLKDRNKIVSIPKIKQIQVGQSKPIYVTNTEFKKICKRVDPHFARAFWFYRETGLRLSEPFNGVINGDFLTITADTAKSKREHEIHLTPELKSVLLEMRGLINEKTNRFMVKRENAIKYYSRVFRFACKGDMRKGIEPIKNRKFHSLRHSCAVRLYLKTRDIYAVMKQLGHSSIETTTIYSKFNEKRLQQDFPDLIQKTSETPKKQAEKTLSDTNLRTQSYPIFA